MEDTKYTNPIVLEDSEEEAPEMELGPIVAHILSNFEKAKTNRRDSEERWLRAYKNYRGRPDQAESFLSTEKSKVFIKITKTKTLAAYGQILDIILSENKVPITIDPTPVPEGTTDTAHIDIEKAEKYEETPPTVDVIGYAGDGNDIIPGESLTDRAMRMISKAWEGVKGEKGPATKKGDIAIDPAKESAKGMERRIKDQMVEADGASNLKKALLECVMLGTGIIKGPFYTEKEYPRWNDQGEYDPVKKIVPKSSHSSIWNIYPDPDCTGMDDCEWIIERHRKTRTEINKLKKQPFFREEKIECALERGPNYTDEYWEQDLHEGVSKQTRERFLVLEYWGMMKKELLETIDGFDMPEDSSDMDMLNVNCWVCNGEVIRLVVNPFKPARIPYFRVPYEEDPYNFFGVGLPENMDDSQSLMNGFARLAIDNAVLAGNVMLEVDEENLVPGTSFDIYSGKIWRRQGGAPGQSVFATTFPNTGQTNMQMYREFRQLADETTGIPSALHGQTGISGIGRTASGISMLLGAATLSIKTVIKNIDDYLLEPLAKAYFAFNMQFDFNEKYLGDLDIKANGVSSLLSKESLSQRLLQFLQVTSADPDLRARRNDEYVLKSIAQVLDLNPDEVTLDAERAALKAKLMQNQEGQKPQQSPGMGGETNPSNEIAGTAGTPMPGTDQFSGNMGGNMNE